MGERAYPDLRSVPEPIDMVDIFRRSEAVVPIVEEAIQVRAKWYGRRTQIGSLEDGASTPSLGKWYNQREQINRMGAGRPAIYGGAPVDEGDGR